MLKNLAVAHWFSNTVYRCKSYELHSATKLRKLLHNGSVYKTLHKRNWWQSLSDLSLILCNN